MTTTPKLILIEGLPGSGKTTAAGLVHELLTKMHLDARLYTEGNLEHPADYDGVACFEEHEFAELLGSFDQYSDFLNEHIIRQTGRCFLEYRRLQQKYGPEFPDELLNAIFQKDIYELPLEDNRKLITERWRKFTADAADGQDIFIFDCCFIQNPVTIGMVKYDADRETVKSYVTELAATIEPLNPLLIYITQNELDHSFRKAVRERPLEWSQGFFEYYTNQGYGARQQHSGLEGTLQVLKARKQLEEDIYSGLTIAKHKVDNSAFDSLGYRQVIAGILEQYYK
ncbi:MULTISPECIES: hypothetical protein [unclassified Paenibacillus]|uniref:hypothetical protein n=1 Tax=unclassified Paenibacillus TaxID=185978 RepID=UPI002406C35F|nr:MULTISPECIES: hypothetical protein [unclassified Paenibacillus]MDF9844352.1 hypothetical protein [Paenibacillus sp. PastF-2]MDF9850956.1 hypothetical protein [Paenibacillus sp. PastM-2]MDF9857527.1 hypothetical protein [Paenibacillus sp. PastF-1]MDH6482832.1 hypothetical protein [Paenibacillus sp. PastH-2]MDH6510257.1 hypothetical protein [Paenibacillus sp. PastM-3]